MNGHNESPYGQRGPRRHLTSKNGSYFQTALLTALFFLLPVITVLGTGQQEGPVNTTDGIAIEGYDPVAYHTMGAPWKAQQRLPQIGTLQPGNSFRRNTGTSLRMTQYQRQFRSGVPGNIIAADRNWPGLRAELKEVTQSE